MPIRMEFLLVTILCGFAVGAEALTPPTDTPQLAVRYIDELDNTKVLANHTLVPNEKGEIDFITGGELPTRGGEPALHFGTRITGTLISMDRQSYRLRMTMELGNPVVSENSATQIVRSDSLTIQTVLAAGKEAGLHCGGKRWIELRVDN